jgi:hypothetical protein
MCLAKYASCVTGQRAGCEGTGGAETPPVQIDEEVHTAAVEQFRGVQVRHVRYVDELLPLRFGEGSPSRALNTGAGALEGMGRCGGTYGMRERRGVARLREVAGLVDVLVAHHDEVQDLHPRGVVFGKHRAQRHVAPVVHPSTGAPSAASAPGATPRASTETHRRPLRTRACAELKEISRELKGRARVGRGIGEDETRRAGGGQERWRRRKLTPLHRREARVEPGSTRCSARPQRTTKY